MLNMFEVIETNNMIEHEKLDVRTITMGISLLDCCDSDLEALNQKIYNKKKFILFAKISFEFSEIVKTVTWSSLYTEADNSRI